MEQAAKGHGGVTLPGSIQKHVDVVFSGTWRSGALGNGSLTAGLDDFPTLMVL